MSLTQRQQREQREHEANESQGSVILRSPNT